MPRGLGKGPGAIVLQEQQSPLQFLMQAQERQQKQAALQAQVEQKQRAAREARFSEWMQYDTGKIYDPFAQQVRGAMSEYRGWLGSHFLAGTASGPMFEAQVQSYQNRLADMASKANAVESKHKQVLDDIGENKYMDMGYYRPLANDVFFYPDGAARNLDDITLSRAYENTITDMGGYQMDKYNKDFWDNAGETVIKTIQDRQGNNGDQVQSSETIKSKVYEPMYDEFGNFLGYEKNADGTLKVNIDDDTLWAFTQDNFADQWLTESLVRQGFEPNRENKRLLVQELANKEAYLRRDVTGRKQVEDKEGKRVSSMEGRAENIRKILQGDKQAMSTAKGLGVEFIYDDGSKVEPEDLSLRQLAGERPESLQVKYRSKRWDPYDERYVWQDVTEPIDLSDPVAAATQLSNVFNEIQPAKFFIDPVEFQNYIKGNYQTTTDDPWGGI